MVFRFVASCSSSEPGEPVRKRAKRPVVEGSNDDCTTSEEAEDENCDDEEEDGSAALPARVIPRSQIAEAYQKHANAIDVHNQRRQALLGIERQYRTRNWEKRLFSTLLGICVVDAHKLFANVTGEDICTVKFAERLFTSLMHNILPGHEEAPCRRTAASSRRSSTTHSQHYLVPLRQHPVYLEERASGDPRRHCHECGRLCRYYCEDCFLHRHVLISLCGTQRHTCFMKHAGVLP